MRLTSPRMIAAGYCLLASVAVAQPSVPQADGWVLDQMGVLSPDAESRLEVELTEFAYSHNHEIAVLLIRSAPEGLAAYGQRVLRSWDLGGDEGRVALLIWSREQGMTIQTGAASGAVLDEEEQGEILIETLGPAIVAGQAERGIVESVRRMMVALSGAPISAPAADNIAESEPQPSPPADVPGMPEITVPGPAEPSPAEEPSPLPGNLIADLDRILGGLNLHPGDTLQALGPEISSQASELPGVLAQGLRELGGESVPQPLGQPRLGLLVALAVCVVVGLISLLRQSWLAVAFIFGLFAAPLLAALTGFVALSLAVFALAAASPILGRLLPVAMRVVLSQSAPGDASGDPRWAPRPNQVVTQEHTITRPQPPASISRKPSGPSQTERPPAQPVKHSATPKTLSQTEWLALKQHVASATGDLLPRPRGWYIAVLIVLFLMAPPLAVIALLGLPCYYAYKLLTLDESRRERLLANPQVRERLQHIKQNHPELYQAIARLQQSLSAGRRGA